MYMTGVKILRTPELKDDKAVDDQFWKELFIINDVMMHNLYCTI